MPDEISIEKVLHVLERPMETVFKLSQAKTPEAQATELAEVKAELRQYKTALNALTGKPSDGKKTVTRKVVHDELTPFLSEQPGGSANRATVDAELRQRLKASGFKLNGIARRINEVLASDSFAVVDDEVTLAKSGN